MGALSSAGGHGVARRGPWFVPWSTVGVASSDGCDRMHASMAVPPATSGRPASDGSDRIPASTVVPPAAGNW